jgi:1-acyl-sn-glycerol-3-phosphate acyltransferase
MVLYVVFRGLARVALRWFYRDVTVVGAEHVPAAGPLLVAVNHPNALVDALVAVSVVPRPVTLTAKATLWEHRLLAPLLDGVGIVPLRRAADEGARRPRGARRPSATPPAGLSRWATETKGPRRPGPTPRSTDAVRDEPLPVTVEFEATLTPGGPPRIETSAEHRVARNLAAFAALLDRLERGGAVLIFPEGKSHSEPQLAPLKTGLARVALQARDERGVRGLRVVPIGLVFERKWQPRSRVLVQVGEPLAVDDWRPAPDAIPADALTAEVQARLRAVTLNFETAKEEAQTLAVARTLAAAFEGDRPLGEADTPLLAAVAVAHRVEAARERLAAGGALPPRAEAFVARLSALRQLAAAHGVRLEDAEIATGLAAGARFTVREGVLALAALPVAAWGAVHHYLPLRLAWWLGLRTSRHQDDPAMRTIVLGLLLVLLLYLLQTGVVWWLAGPWWALLYLATLPPAGVVHLRFTDRVRRALRRARTYRLFRRDPALRARFAAELAWVREEAVEIERA